MMPIKTYKKIETILLYFVIKKNLKKIFQNGPEHGTTCLNIGALHHQDNALELKNVLIFIAKKIVFLILIS